MVDAFDERRVDRGTHAPQEPTPANPHALQQVNGGRSGCFLLLRSLLAVSAASTDQSRTSHRTIAPPLCAFGRGAGRRRGGRWSGRRHLRGGRGHHEGLLRMPCFIANGAGPEGPRVDPLLVYIKLLQSCRTSCPPCAPKSYLHQSQRAPRLSNSCPTLAEELPCLLRFRPKLGQVLPEVGRIWSNFGRIRPAWAGLGQSLPNSSQFRPNNPWCVRARVHFDFDLVWPCASRAGDRGSVWRRNAPVNALADLVSCLLWRCTCLGRPFSLSEDALDCFCLAVGVGGLMRKKHVRSLVCTVSSYHTHTHRLEGRAARRAK